MSRWAFAVPAILRLWCGKASEPVKPPPRSPIRDLEILTPKLKPETELLVVICAGDLPESGSLRRMRAGHLGFHLSKRTLALILSTSSPTFAFLTNKKHSTWLQNRKIQG